MKSELLYLHHIRERCRRVGDCVRAGRDEFLGNVVYQDAVMRNLEIIDEAVKRISPELRAQLAELPWRPIAGLRVDPRLPQFRIWSVFGWWPTAMFRNLLRLFEGFLREHGGI